MQVPTRADQHNVMLEVVGNHTPEVVVVDEITTYSEAQTAQTIAQRGIQLVASAHGRFGSLVRNPVLCSIIGGLQAVILGDSAAKRGDGKKSQIERVGSPTFSTCLEVISHDSVILYEDVGTCIDLLLKKQPCTGQLRRMRCDHMVEVSDQCVQ